MAMEKQVHVNAHVVSCNIFNSTWIWQDFDRDASSQIHQSSQKYGYAHKKTL